MAKTIGFWSTRALIATIGLCGLVWIYYSAIAAVPPLTWIGSAVYPSIVRAGAEINVLRQYTVHREVIVEVQRKLVSGDCSGKVSCLQYDLAPSTFVLEGGENSRIRKHHIPDHIVPGKYRLEFELHWQNAIGYRYAVKHPPLEIEVIK